MSEISSVVERTRNAFASLARLEAAVALDPTDRGLQLNLAGCRKIALQYERQLLSVSEKKKTEVCKYRLIPEATDSFALVSVADSIGSYQKLFSQIYDAKKHGKKVNVGYGVETLRESTLEFGYSYSGSLGIVLLSSGENSQDLVGGSLSSSIDSLFQVIDIKSQADVRAVAEDLGLAVVKRLHSWSNANHKGGFATDVRWTRADGKEQGQVVECERMASIVNLIDATTDEKIREISVIGRLVGIDLKARTFHLLGPRGTSFRGALAQEFPLDQSVAVGRSYECRLVETTVTRYAAEKIDHSYQLKKLDRLSKGRRDDSRAN
jgi:hypothetical protein